MTTAAEASGEPSDDRPSSVRDASEVPWVGGGRNVWAEANVSTVVRKGPEVLRWSSGSLQDFLNFVKSDPRRSQPDCGECQSRGQHHGFRTHRPGTEED